MCIPMAAAALASTVLSAVGTGVSALSAKSQADYQAKIAERNAGLEREANQVEQQATREEALAHYRNVAKLKGEQIVGAAANGVGVDFGTAADTLADTDMLAREDVKRIYDQGGQKMKGRDISASNYLAEASAQRSAGKGALVSGVLNMGSTVLGGVSQYNKLRGPTSAKGLAKSAAKTVKQNSGIF